MSLTTGNDIAKPENEKVQSRLKRKMKEAVDQKGKKKKKTEKRVLGLKKMEKNSEMEKRKKKKNLKDIAEMEKKAKKTGTSKEPGVIGFVHNRAGSMYCSKQSAIGLIGILNTTQKDYFQFSVEVASKKVKVSHEQIEKASQPSGQVRWRQRKKIKEIECWV